MLSYFMVHELRTCSADAMRVPDSEDGWNLVVGLSLRVPLLRRGICFADTREESRSLADEVGS